MSILSAQSIRHLALSVNLISPFVEDGEFNGLSYGLSASSYDVRLRDGCVLRPGDSVLGVTIETVHMPKDIKARVMDKSTWARKFLMVANTHIDPGFQGCITLELTHHGQELLRLLPGTPIAQLEFAWLDELTDKPYKGKYQNAGPFAQPAIFKGAKDAD